MLKCKASSNRQPLHSFLRESSYHLHHSSFSLLPLMLLLLAFSIVILYPLLRILLEPGNLPGEKKRFSQNFDKLFYYQWKYSNFIFKYKKYEILVFWFACLFCFYISVNYSVQILLISEQICPHTESLQGFHLYILKYSEGGNIWK